MDARAAELEAQATRVQTRGPVTDYFGCGPEVEFTTEDGPGRGRLALVRCVHGVEWPEGGFGCTDCIPAAHAASAAMRAAA